MKMKNGGKSRTSRYTSIKTRIETKCMGAWSGDESFPLATLPSKQGLKRMDVRRQCSQTNYLSLHFHQNKD